MKIVTSVSRFEKRHVIQRKCQFTLLFMLVSCLVHNFTIFHVLYITFINKKLYIVLYNFLLQNDEITEKWHSFPPV